MKNNQFFDDLKKEYNNINASEEFIMKMNKQIKKENTKRKIRVSITAAAAFIVLAGVTLNSSPALAYALSDVPVISSIVNVVTFGKYTVKDDGYELDINTPKIEGLSNKDLEENLNNTFKEQADTVKELFQKNVDELKAEVGDETVHMDIEFNYDVKTNNDDILALDVYTFYASGSSNSVHNYYTINKKTGELYTLKGMFKDGADYVTPITNYIKDEINRRNLEENGMYFPETFDKIAEDQNFYINNDGNIVICFGKYEIAAGAQGTPEFVIPNEVVADIIK